MTARPTPTESAREAAESAQRDRFAITDERSAVWYLRKLRSIEEERTAVEAATAQRLAELDTDRRRLEALFGVQLEAWAREESQRRRRKTITLPLAGCAVALRTVPAKVEIGDRATAEEVARSLGYVRTAPDLAGYRAAAVEALADRGELLPGCRLTEETERLSVRRIDDRGAAPHDGDATTAEEAPTE